MGQRKLVKTSATARVAMLLLAVLLFAGACSGDPKANPGDENEAPTGQAERRGDTTPSLEGGKESTGDTSTPEVTLGREPKEDPEIVIRLEGDPKTTFTGLCSVGSQRSVLSGQVPKRFTFDLSGERLECRIEKRDEGQGELKVVLVAGETTRSVQQTNAPGGVVNLSYEDG
ncbi:MAG: hypothetical protein M3151_15380 [Actinomycetota bacterium]|nr:hypothetical protein [Actinomycetota bacterium]